MTVSDMLFDFALELREKDMSIYPTYQKELLEALPTILESIALVIGLPKGRKFYQIVEILELPNGHKTQTPITDMVWSNRTTCEQYLDKLEDKEIYQINELDVY